LLLQIHRIIARVGLYVHTYGCMYVHIYVGLHTYIRTYVHTLMPISINIIKQSAALTEKLIVRFAK